MPVSPVLSFMASPLHHRDECLGTIYVAGKEGAREFSLEDEETLVNTSPVGVVVSDVRTGIPVSVNWEARRILEGLMEPGLPLEGAHGAADGPARRWEGDIPGRVPPRGGVQRRRDGEGRGARPPGPRRPERHSPGQRHSRPLRGRRVGVLCGHSAGHDSAGGDGTAAGRLSGDGEPRTAGTARLHTRLRDHPAAR